MVQLTILVEALDLIVVADGPSPAGEEGEEEDGSVRDKESLARFQASLI